jgi:ParB-like chromosome segregation protein Spo0J
VAKKKTSLSQTLFGQIDPYGTTSEELSSPALEEPQITLPVERIRPDPNQPRQLLPPALSEALATGRLTPIEALGAWLKQAEESGSTAAQRPVRELRRLATSIAQHGLINPITVRTTSAEESLSPHTMYVIVTGERRYWSHVLLTIEGRSIQEGSKVIDPSQIKAIIVQAGVSVRAHQLIENLMREDINAVEKARGLWALRYELSGVNHG